MRTNIAVGGVLALENFSLSYISSTEYISNGFSQLFVHSFYRYKVLQGIN